MNKENETQNSDSKHYPEITADTINTTANLDQLIDSLCLMNDEFMTICFQDNIPAVEEVLNAIFDRYDLKIIHLEVQSVKKSPVSKGRGVRLDVFAKDAAGKFYDIEIQRADQGAGSRRARLYSAMIDARMLKAGEDFDDMKDSYVIFITENDVLKENRPLYHIQRTVLESGKIFDDGNHLIYVNGAYPYDGSRISKLIHDFKCTKPEKMYNDELKKTIAHFKSPEGGKNSMYNAFEVYGNAIRKETEKKYETTIAEKDHALAAKDNALAANQAQLAAKDDALAAKDDALAANQAALAANQAALAANQAALAAKDDALASNQAEIEQLKAALKDALHRLNAK